MEASGAPVISLEDADPGLLHPEDSAGLDLVSGEGVSPLLLAVAHCDQVTQGWVLWMGTMNVQSILIFGARSVSGSGIPGLIPVQGIQSFLDR